jgi:hypothetical protein
MSAMSIRFAMRPSNETAPRRGLSCAKALRRAVAVSRVAIWRYAASGARRVLDGDMISNKLAADLAINAASFRGQKKVPSVAPGVRSRRAWRHKPPRLVREARQTGELYPETEHPQANLRVPANFARSRRQGRYAARWSTNRACIVANVPSGATMPHEAPGAVGEHGCRRRAE